MRVTEVMIITYMASVTICLIRWLCKEETAMERARREMREEIDYLGEGGLSAFVIAILFIPVLNTVLACRFLFKQVRSLFNPTKP